MLGWTVAFWAVSVIPSYLLGAVAVDPDRQIHRPVRHDTLADLDHQRVDEHPPHRAIGERPLREAGGRT